ncbi:MAG: YfiR family protein [Desulfobacterales bacterium]|nr:YfiR family protein [Desulfobacterales bacterium]
MLVKGYKLFIKVSIGLMLLFETHAYADSVLYREYLVKAAFLYNFAKFVDWPIEVFEDEHAPIYLCILGKNPFDDDVIQSIENKTVDGRKLLVETSKHAKDHSKCHILFISRSMEKEAKQILTDIKDRPVLTVSDIAEFTSLGGIIEFIVINNKIRFEINIDSARHAGLKISSHLLKMAKIVKS